MPITQRYIPLVLIGFLSACINVPEIEPSTPDSGTPPITQPDAGKSEDTVLPSITRSAPASGSTNVALNSGLEVEFSEPMNIDTVQVSISPPVPLGAPTWSLGNSRLLIQPSSSLAQNASYTLTLAGKDVAGNELTGLRIISFSTTGPAPDTTPPTSLGFLPSNSAMGVERTGLITILFSEPMNKASVQSAFMITSPIGFNSGAFAWNEASTEMTYRPNADFSYGTSVDWQVSTTAKDASGNLLQTLITGTFRIIRLNTLTINFDLSTSGSLSKPNYIRQSPIYNLEVIGDGAGNDTYRLFIGFKLNELPENTISITRGTLKWWITGQQGDPFEKFGNLLLEQVHIGDNLDGNGTEGGSNPAAEKDFNAAPLSSAIVVSTNISSTQGIFDITPLLRKDWADRAILNHRSQFRLRFEKDSDGDGNRDMLYSDVDITPKLAELEVTYEYP
jgi:hypothetical protein